MLLTTLGAELAELLATLSSAQLLGTLGAKLGMAKLLATLGAVWLAAMGARILQIRASDFANSWLCRWLCIYGPFLQLGRLLRAKDLQVEARQTYPGM